MVQHKQTNAMRDKALGVIRLSTGYVYKFPVYLSKQGGMHCTNEGNNYHLKMENFYWDPHLFIECMNPGIYCYGTVRSGRKGFPKDILIAKADEKHLPRGHYQFKTHDQLVAMSWFDRSGVYLLQQFTRLKSLFTPFQLYMYHARMGMSK